MLSNQRPKGITAETVGREPAYAMSSNKATYRSMFDADVAAGWAERFFGSSPYEAVLSRPSGLRPRSIRPDRWRCAVVDHR